MLDWLSSPFVEGIRLIGVCFGYRVDVAVFYEPLKLGDRYTLTLLARGSRKDWGI